MSFERAAKNCMRCYKHSNNLRNIEYQISVPVLALQHNQDYVTNEAMKALEDVTRKGTAQEKVLANRCLTACLHCDYSQAKIYGILLEENAVTATTK